MNTILIVMALIGFSLLVMGVILNEREKKKAAEQSIFSHKKNNNSSLIKLYDKLYDSKITRRYIRRIAKRYEIFYPESKKEVAVHTMRLTLKLIICSMISVIIIFGFSPSLFTALSSSFIVYVIHIEFITGTLKNAEINLLTQLEQFCSDIKHYYFSCKNIETSVWEAMDHTKSEMRLHANKLFDVLKSDDIENAVRHYNETSAHKYLKMLLLTCVNVMEYGDTKSKGESVLGLNLLTLKEQMHDDLNKIKREKFVFSGLSFITALPVLLMPFIKNWALTTLPGMETIYVGKYDVFLKAFGLIISFVLFNILIDLEDSKDLNFSEYKYLHRLVQLPVLNKHLNNYIDKNFGKFKKLEETLRRMGENQTLQTLLLNRILYAVFSLVLSLTIIITTHSLTKYNLVNTTNNIESLVSVTTDEQLDLMNNLVIKYVNEYKKDVSITEESVKEKLLKEVPIKHNVIISPIAREVYKRVLNYQNEYLKWQEVIVCFMLSFLAFWYPIFKISYRQSIIMDRMNEEIQNFHLVISMQINCAGVNAVTLLEAIEIHSSIFKNSLQKCINNFNYNDYDALEQLKRDEPYEPMRHLVDCFMMIDSTDVKTAFDEITVDIQNFKLDRKLEYEMVLSKRLQRASLVALTPGIYVLMVYLLGPMVIVSMNQLDSMNSEINNFAKVTNKFFYS